MSNQVQRAEIRIGLTVRGCNMTKKSPHEDRSKKMCVFFYILHTENQKHDINPQKEDILRVCGGCLG